MESNGRGNQQEENIREAVLKLTTLSGKHQGMDAAPQTHHLPVAMETNSKGNYGEAVALVHLCPYVSLYEVSDYVCCVVSEHRAARSYAFTHLCCGWGYRWRNLRSR